MEGAEASVKTFGKPKYEKKCERDFKKLLESGNGRTAMTYSKKKCIFPENVNKKLKNSEENDNKDPNPSTNSTFSTSQKLDSENFEHIDALKPENNFVFPLVTSKLNVDLQYLSECLSQQNCFEARCQSVIGLAVFCSENLSNTELSTVLEAIHLLTNSHESDILAISHSLLLLSLTKKTSNLDQIIYLEESILRLANSVMLTSDELGKISLKSKLSLLRSEEYLTAFKLVQKFFPDRNVDIDAIDVLTLCCSSLRNLTCNTVGEKYMYKENTLKFILGMTGKATQEIVSENLVKSEGECSFVSVPSLRVHQCLQMLEHVLSVDPDLSFKTLDHEDFSLLHCLTKLFGWCMSFLFQKSHSENSHCNVEKSLSSFHLATLISILKILSILSFNPNQYDSFTNIRGLMEKVMICILKAYYESEEKHFDVLVLALELMINFYLKNKKTFVLLCLKKFQINSCEQILSIEALMRILSNSLEKINEIRTASLAPSQNGEARNNNEGENSNEDEMKQVLEAADEDMELSTISSFISILLTYFVDAKASFAEFIRERLPSEKANEAISVCKKVLQFASITGGMPVTGLLLLKFAVRKLSRLHSST